MAPLSQDSQMRLFELRSRVIEKESVSFHDVVRLIDILLEEPDPVVKIPAPPEPVSA